MDESALVQKTVEIVVQINAKIVNRLTIATDATEADVVKQCADCLKGATPQKRFTSKTN